MSKWHQLVSAELGFRALFPGVAAEADSRIIGGGERVFDLVIGKDGKSRSGFEGLISVVSLWGAGFPIPSQAYLVKVNECHCYDNLSEAQLLAEYERLDNPKDDPDCEHHHETKNINVNGHPGRQSICTISDDSSGVILGKRIFIYQSRIYEASVVASYLGNKRDPNLVLTARKFLESFALNN